MSTQQKIRTYSFKEILEKCRISREMIRRRRNAKDGKKLIPVEDYFFDYDKHRILYTESGLQKLMKQNTKK